MRSAPLLLGVLLIACTPLGVPAAKVPLEQELLAEARADADSIVQHRRCVLRDAATAVLSSICIV